MNFILAIIDAERYAATSGKEKQNQAPLISTRSSFICYNSCNILLTSSAVCLARIRTYIQIGVRNQRLLHSYSYRLTHSRRRRIHLNLCHLVGLHRRISLLLLLIHL
ncbi:hypothetical protein TTHERM_000857999 (macronuclear) [Tetrahymena thermophila SB210]|uniref:Uncharacterized protein n=1 Tax=Tetrahymena thermophila (strain SB210) TaxID=312017 RepID=W7X101_TETTS|nr:hypothetical protein TTHERM_000857999 [Tetrahymena thermophila SB210]EWS72835.1 hypothetical protein TTHERM_000857999 [Tetrahymena thermophila SB210]|eukprot:XP_012654626.1 hypothetical protein TTHERM_000857999 [Tetrahymena thermophila SB210]